MRPLGARLDPGIAGYEALKLLGYALVHKGLIHGAESHVPFSRLKRKRLREQAELLSVKSPSLQVETRIVFFSHSLQLPLTAALTSGARRSRGLC